MKVELNKNDLVNLVLGVYYPKYSKFDKLVELKLGNYLGGFEDSWLWDKKELEKLSEEDLYKIYKWLFA